jgi:cysteine desulfuration protein SufE
MIQQKIDDLKSKFDRLPTWEDKYSYVISFGKKNDSFDEQMRKDEYIVRGCQSQVWLYTDMDENHIRFYSDSDALITKGIVSLLTHVYSDEPPNDILEHEPTFLKEIGLIDALSPTRQNGLKSMLVKIKEYAQALKLLNNNEWEG